MRKHNHREALFSFTSNGTAVNEMEMAKMIRFINCPFRIFLTCRPRYNGTQMNLPQSCNFEK